MKISKLRRLNRNQRRRGGELAWASAVIPSFYCTSSPEHVQPLTYVGPLNTRVNEFVL